MDVENRIFKPLEINGLRLYRVLMTFPSNKKWDSTHIVVAKSLSDAARLIKQAYSDFELPEEPIIKPFPLDVYQPIKWPKGDKKNEQETD